MNTIDDRKDHNRQELVGLTRFVATALVVPALLLALVVLALTRNPLLTILALVIGYGAGAAFVYLGGRGLGPKLLARPDIEIADDATYPRLHNLVDGLCVAHGLTKPDLYVVRTDARNACTIAVDDRDTKKVALVITTGLADVLSRIELEGILAQQLTHVRDGDTALSTMVASVASLPLVGGVVASRAGACLDPHLEQVADLGGVGFTRYPPGLASALEHLVDHETAVPDVPPLTAHLWLADPLPEAVPEPFVPHPRVADRIIVLREL